MYLLVASKRKNDHDTRQDFYLVLELWTAIHSYISINNTFNLRNPLFKNRPGVSRNSQQAEKNKCRAKHDKNYNIQTHV